MVKKLGIIIAFFMAVLTGAAPLAAPPMSATFLNPGGRGDAFFGMMTGFMQAAADDLGVALEVVYCDRDHLKMQEEGRRILSRPELPQYLLLINEKNSAVELMKSASAKGVKVALINEGLQPENIDDFGPPGDRLANWVLEMLPDDNQAGYMLAKALIAAARQKGLDGADDHVHMVGLAGTFKTGSSSSRVAGLQRAVREDGRATLNQVVPAYWEEGRAAKLAPQLLSRYPQTTIIWAASDLMARGAYTSVMAPGTLPDRVVTGGIDWAEFALPMVAAGRFAATVGGHFMDGGWALVMLYDQHHGVPLPESRYRTEFSLITADNVDEYLDNFSDHDWSAIDFRRFSKSYNPELTHYRFGLESVIEQLRDAK